MPSWDEKRRIPPRVGLKQTEPVLYSTLFHANDQRVKSLDVLRLWIAAFRSFSFVHGWPDPAIIFIFFLITAHAGPIFVLNLFHQPVI